MKLKRMTAIFALVLIASTAAPTLSMKPGVASAASSGKVKATFTKWVIGDVLAGDTTSDQADMIGVVGGKSGPGFFFGEILNMNTIGTTTTIHAVYHINGSKWPFVADVTITQNNSTGVASITGTVTAGALSGANVSGEYKVMSSCPVPTPGNIYGTVCFQGSLTVAS